MSAANLDQADRAQRGTLARDPTAETKVVAAQVPRVLTVDAILNASAVRAMATRPRDSLVTTGHYKLDKITGGLRPGFTWVIGADTSWGKSSFLIAIADDNLKRRKRVLIVSSEDTEEVYGDRLMVRRAQVNAVRFRDNSLWTEEKQRIGDVAAKAEDVPVYVDARRWAIEDLAPHLTKLIREERIDVVAFDYVQEFSSKKRWQDERVKYREIASVCRHIAKDAKIAGIIFSQLTLDDKTKIPNRHNIRECRDIANAAEVILIGFEPEADIVDKKTKTVVVHGGTKCIFVDKVKNGPRGGKIPMTWNHEHACFETVEDPEIARLREAAGDVDDYLPGNCEDH